ncbi:LytTR family DNA-binding domain-containing protein [Fluviicola sp.]|uniref:LytTR family DNA-binding domain-containing protein n=1 Tax=Fluviicola sp. TaxID=1917219 RepID=UPI00260DE899|nr:LytTR family DNA-binding domain-containing protein [Fluviicola sp.]
MSALKRQIHFTSSLNRKILIGFILCVYLCFIVIVLQPFDTSQFDAEYKTLLLFGYGIFAFVVFVIYGSIENVAYFRAGKVWTIRHEIISTLLYCFFSGTVLYMYNRTIVNNFKDYTLWTYWRFLSITVLCMIPVFVPPMIYLRQKFGEKIIPPAENSMVLIGENKNEILRMEKDELLFVKAIENYVEICFTDESKKVISLTFRQTLHNVSVQLPFLEKCHRSYLVNAGMIKEITGNSQGAKISFVVSEKEIPLSKTYYKEIKNGRF